MSTTRSNNDFIFIQKQEIERQCEEKFFTQLNTMKQLHDAEMQLKDKIISLLIMQSELLQELRHKDTIIASQASDISSKMSTISKLKTKISHYNK